MLATITAGLGLKAQNVVYDENAEVRTLPAFTGIDVSGTISLYLAQGTSQGVAVSAGEAKYNSKIKTEVKNGILQISVDGGMWNSFNWSNKKLKAYVTVTDLSSLEVSGASYITTTGTIKSNALKLEISGASEIKADLQVNTLNVDISGASIAHLAGAAKDGNIEASGACKLSGYEMKLDKCRVSCSGASVVKVMVNNELNADASGGSAIYYKGTPTNKNLNTSAASSIKYKGDDD